jgi:hypothetical protein
MALNAVADTKPSSVTGSSYRLAGAVVGDGQGADASTGGEPDLLVRACAMGKDGRGAR